MKRYIHLLGLALVGIAFTIAVAHAAESPLDISASESLEWYEATGLYVARGEAKAVRGETTIEADLLTAHKRDKAKDQKQDTAQEGVAGDLDLITAEGNVFIHSPTQKIFGQKGVYDLDKKIIKITGNNLKYMTENDVVTAQDSLEYYEDKGIAVARGKALALHAGNRIEADILSANFAQGTSGQREMKKMMAKGHVVIITKEGNVARSKRAIYDVKRDVALLLEDVKLKQGEMLLAGDRAEVDFKTGQSRLLNDGSGRVRALLSSKSEKEAK